MPCVKNLLICCSTLYKHMNHTLMGFNSNIFKKAYNLTGTSSSKFVCFSSNDNQDYVKLAHQVYEAPSKPTNPAPIVILHGLLGSKTNWNAIAKAIVRDTNREVITLDARNHGDSPHTDGLSYELMVSDLKKFMEDKSLSKVSLIGHSMGGRTSMLFTQKYIHLVESLVVVDISPVGHSPNMMELPKLFTTIKKLTLDPSMTLREARQSASSQLKLQEVDDMLISFLMTNLVENGEISNWRWRFNIDSIIKNFESGICRFPASETSCSVPTLFVAGGKSDYIQKKNEPVIKEMFSEAKFVYIPDAGHWVHAEKPKEFLLAVTPFLS